jgi:hypothetical protein
MNLGVLIMARAPRPGEVKTRLEPLLGTDGCAGLQAELIRHAAGWAARCTPVPWLAFSPADAREEVERLLPAGVRLFEQEGEDLGSRLRHATQRVFLSRDGPLAVIGTDAPQLGPVHLRFVERAFSGDCDACLIPALDGGYALIALRRPMPLAFELPSDAWGQSDVLELTLSALREAGCSWSLLEAVRDLDTPEDAPFVAANPRCPRPIRDILCSGTPA